MVIRPRDGSQSAVVRELRQENGGLSVAMAAVRPPGVCRQRVRNDTFRVQVGGVPLMPHHFFGAPVVHTEKKEIWQAVGMGGAMFYMSVAPVIVVI